MSPALRAAHVVVGLAAVTLPLAQSALLAAGGDAAWPAFAALAAGVLVRALAGTGPTVMLALGLAPVWQAISSAVGPDADFRHVVPWLAFLSAALAWPRARAGGWWGVATTAWALLLALVAPVVAVRELDFSRQAIGALTINGTSGSAPHLMAGFVLLAAEAQLLALLLFDWYSTAAPVARRQVWMSLLPGVAAAAGVAVWQQHVDPTLLSREPWTGLRRSAGTFFDANATGALLSLTAPFLLSSLARPRFAPRLLWGGFWLVLSLAGILATGSRSALVSLAVVLAVRAVSLGRPLPWLGLATAGGLVAAFVAYAPVSDYASGNALGRLAGSIRDVTTGGTEGAWRLLWNRYGYGPAAMAMIADHPWIGTGPGMFPAMVADYARQVSGLVLPPDNAQNWWRHQAAELGLGGALPAFVCSLMVLVALVRAVGHGERMLRMAPLVGLGLLALFSPPMSHPILQVIVGLVIAHAVPTDGASSPSPAPPTARRAGLVVWLLAGGCAVATGVEGWRDFRPPYRATRFQFPYSYGVSALGPTPYGEGRWMATRAVAVLPPEGRTLVVRVVVPHEDAAARPVPVTVSTRLGVACRHDAIDSSPFECRTAVPADAWPMVQVDVGRVWRTEDGQARAAVVVARFEP